MFEAVNPSGKGVRVSHPLALIGACSVGAWGHAPSVELQLEAVFGDTDHEFALLAPFGYAVAHFGGGASMDGFV
ncbi:MAG: hypothetical protein ACI9ZV_000093 [Candidatus Azotimanducaceae bacterium]